MLQRLQGRRRERVNRIKQTMRSTKQVAITRVPRSERHGRLFVTQVFGEGVVKKAGLQPGFRDGTDSNQHRRRKEEEGNKVKWEEVRISRPR